METAESIYKDVVKPSYIKPTLADANRDGHIMHNIGESASLWTRPYKGESADKRIKQRVDSPTVKSKTCLIHVPKHSSNECKVLWYFGTKYANSRPTKDSRINPVPREKINRQE